MKTSNFQGIEYGMDMMGWRRWVVLVMCSSVEA